MTTSPLLFFPYLVVSILLLLAAVGGRAGLKKDQNLPAALFAGLTVLYFFYIIISFSTSAAFIDDYNLLDSFHRMLFSPAVPDRIKAFFEQVNEHRFAFERVLMYLIYLFSGHPSPQLQIITGNLFLLGILWLFYLLFRQTGRPPVYFLPVVPVLFSLAFYENAFWGIAAIQNTPLIFFAMLSVYGLSRQSGSGNITGILAALTTTFVSGSGISIWIIGALILVLQKRYRFLLLWLLTAAAIVAFYFTFDYTMYPKDRSDLLRHPFKNLWFFLCFLGSLFYGDFDHGAIRKFYPDVAASVIAGGLLLLISLWTFLSAYLNRQGRQRATYSFLSGILLFPLATGAMLVVSRPLTHTIVFGGEFISQRYLIFSAVFWVGCYLALLFLNRKNNAAPPKIFYLFLALGTGINFASYYRHLPALATHRATLELDKLYSDSFDGVLLSFGKVYNEKNFWNHPTAFPNLLRDLEKTGLYNPKPVFDVNWLKQIRTSGAGSPGAHPGWKVSFDFFDPPGASGDAEAKVKLTTTLPDPSQSPPRYFVLQSATEQFVLPAVPERAAPIESLRRLSYWSDTYSYQFPALKFPAGQYETWIIYGKNGENPGFVRTGDSLNLRNGISYH